MNKVDDEETGNGTPVKDKGPPPTTEVEPVPTKEEPKAERLYTLTRRSGIRVLNGDKVNIILSILFLILLISGLLASIIYRASTQFKDPWTKPSVWRRYRDRNKDLRSQPGSSGQ